MRVSIATVHGLFEKFRETNFFVVRDEYVADVGGRSAYIVTLSYDGRSKRVVDYLGSHAGMPMAVTFLEGAIDETAQTGRWVGDDN